MPAVIDVVLILVLAIIIGAAVTYIVKAKKSGAKCIGCPMASKCGSKTGCSCHTDNDKL